MRRATVPHHGVGHPGAHKLGIRAFGVEVLREQRADASRLPQGARAHSPQHVPFVARCHRRTRSPCSTMATWASSSIDCRCDTNAAGARFMRHSSHLRSCTVGHMAAAVGNAPDVVATVSVAAATTVVVVVVVAVVVAVVADVPLLLRNGVCWYCSAVVAVAAAGAVVSAAVALAGAIVVALALAPAHAAIVAVVVAIVVASVAVVAAAAHAAGAATDAAAALLLRINDANSATVRPPLLRGVCFLRPNKHLLALRGAGGLDGVCWYLRPGSALRGEGSEKRIKLCILDSAIRLRGGLPNPSAGISDPGQRYGERGLSTPSLGILNKLTRRPSFDARVVGLGQGSAKGPV